MKTVAVCSECGVEEERPENLTCPECGMAFDIENREEEQGYENDVTVTAPAQYVEQLEKLVGYLETLDEYDGRGCNADAPSSIWIGTGIDRQHFNTKVAMEYTCAGATCFKIEWKYKMPRAGIVLEFSSFVDKETGEIKDKRVKCDFGGPLDGCYNVFELYDRLAEKQRNPRSPDCPQCGGDMKVSEINGEEYWTCIEYVACHGSLEKGVSGE